MNFYQYKGQKVEVVRHYKIGGKRYVDLRALSNGEVFKGLSFSLIKEANKQAQKHKHASEKISAKKKEIIAEKVEEEAEKVEAKSKIHEVEFQKNGKVVVRVAYPSKDYNQFIKNNKLNPVMVQNCIMGSQKSHKGFQVTVIK